MGKPRPERQEINIPLVTHSMKKEPVFPDNDLGDIAFMYITTVGSLIPPTIPIRILATKATYMSGITNNNLFNNNKNVKNVKI